MNQTARRHLEDAVFHLGNAQRSFNAAMLAVKSGREHDGLCKLVGYNAKLTNATRQVIR